MPRCKNCKEVFEQYEFNNKFCKKEECQVKKALYNLDKIKKQTKKDWNNKKKKLKEDLKTVQELLKETQKVFNEYIRLRDEGLPCISCGNDKPKKINAGHFYSSGGHKNVTFDEFNVHLQCEYCNTYLSGNLIEYRKGLIERIGLTELQLLEARAHKERKFTREELREIKEIYKQKIKELK